MSKLDYSKWDRIELSDDEDIECHPNIDKASWVRWRQQDIHRKREERKLKIAQLNAEHKTNIQLDKMMKEWELELTGSQLSHEQKLAKVETFVKQLKEFEKERKKQLLDPESDQFMQAKDANEVFFLLLSRLLVEAKLENASNEELIKKLPEIFVAEYPKLEKRQKDILVEVKKEEEEQNKKLTSENMYHEGFSKTIMNASAPAKRKETKQEQSVEVLNPDYQKNQKSEEGAGSEYGLRDLDDEEQLLMIEFSKIKSFEESFKFIQKHPRIVQREISDHLMARVFQLEMAGKSAEARQNCKWALAISYCLQMGQDGTGLFYKRLLTGGKEPIAVFQQDVDQTFNRIKERCKVLKKEKEQTKDDIDESNSNLTPEQAQAFKTFPKHFQDALMSNEIEKINESFSKMDETESKRIMELCEKTGLISVLSEEEAKKYQAQVI